MRKVFLCMLFSLFTLFSGDFLFTTNTANAACCMCTSCSSWCTCRGTTAACPKCAFPDSPTFGKERQLLSELFVSANWFGQPRQFANESQCKRKIMRLVLLEAKYQTFKEQPFLVTNMPS